MTSAVAKPLDRECLACLLGMLGSDYQAQCNAHEKLKDMAVPEPYETPQPITTSAPELLYSSRDDWRAATEKLIGYRDLGVDRGEENC